MAILKPVQSVTLETDIVPYSGVGYFTTTGESLTFTYAQRDPNNGRPFSNLYSSFKLPINSLSANTWTIPTTSNFSGLNQSEVVVISISKNNYGELIDGRTIHLVIPTGDTSGTGTVDIYSSYITTQNWSSENHPWASIFGNSVNNTLKPNVGLPSTNIAFLFSDNVVPPTNASNTSWSNGYPSVWANDGATKPTQSPVGYNSGNQGYYNTIQSSSGVTGIAAKPPVDYTNDTPVGIAYLDKGFIVLTNPTLTSSLLVSGATSYTFSGGSGYDTSGLYTGSSSGLTLGSYTASTSARCEYYTFDREYLVKVECLAGANEFNNTENITAAPTNLGGVGGGNTVVPGLYSLVGGEQEYSTYITEIGLYDSNQNLIAVAKPDRPIEKPSNSQQPFTLKFKF